MIQHKKSSWCMFPDYRDTVPYQALLDKELVSYFEVRFAWLQTLISNDVSVGDVYHLHWQHAIYNHSQSIREAQDLFAEFTSNIKLLKAKGGRLVWTVHNIIPHEIRYPLLDEEMNDFLVREADLIHFHSQHARDQVLHNTSESTSVVYPCPSFKSYYPDTVTQRQAREYFGIGFDKIVYLTFGMSRGYKGIDLVEKVARSFTDKKICFLIVGQGGNESRKRYTNVSNIVRVSRFIEDAAVQYCFNAADFTTFPYKAITTSGNIPLSLGFGRPAIIPALPSLMSVYRGTEGIVSYDSTSELGLHNALTDASKMPLCDYRAKVESGLQWAAQHSFAGLARALAKRVCAVSDWEDDV